MTQELIERLLALGWKAPVPDDIQSEVRMQFNEALAGGPNMNGDGGPTLTPNHALDCVLATERIQSQSARIAELREALQAIVDGSVFNQQRFAEDDDADYFLRCFKAVKERAQVSLTKDSTSG